VCKVRSREYRIVLRRLYTRQCRWSIVQLCAYVVVNGIYVITLTRGVDEKAQAAAGCSGAVIYAPQPKKVTRSRLNVRQTVVCAGIGCRRSKCRLRQIEHILRTFYRFLR